MPEILLPSPAVAWRIIEERMRESQIGIEESVDNRLAQRQFEDQQWQIIGGTTRMAWLPSQKDMLRRCRMFFDLNPLAKHVVNMTTWFTFGEGLTKPKAKDEKVQESINTFWDDPDNKLSLTGFIAQMAISQKLQLEGELFPCLFENHGATKVRFHDASEIDSVIKAPGDRLRNLWYRRTSVEKKYNFVSDSWEASTPRILYHPDVLADDWRGPANESLSDYGPPKEKIAPGYVGQIKVNCDLNDERGIPEVYCYLDWLRAHKSMAEDLSTLTRAISQFAWKQKIQGSSAQVATQAAARRTGTDLANPSAPVGAFWSENQGIEMTAIPSQTGAVQIYPAGLRQMRLMVAAGASYPEHYLGDTETSNLATATSLELPILKKILARQKLFETIYRMILDWVIKKALHESTKLDFYYDLDFPPITKNDLSQYIVALVSAGSAGFLTDEMTSQLIMLAVGVNNIPEELEKMYAKEENPKAKVELKEAMAGEVLRTLRQWRRYFEEKAKAT